jgi:hypothetical protein
MSFTQDSARAGNIPSPAGAFNFAFISFAQTNVQAGNIAVEQKGTDNAASDISLSLTGKTNDFNL